MSKRDKKGVLGASAHKESSEKAREVAAKGKVGKGVPPEAFKWRPGQSGNPSGLPSAHREVIVDAVKAMLEEVDPKLNKNLFERLLEQCARRALQGSKWHMGVLLDYGLGKPRQSVEVDNKVSYTDMLVKARERLAAADQTIRDYFQITPGLVPVVPTNGHSDPQTAQAAAAMPEQDLTAAREDDAEGRAADVPRPKMRVELQ